jgi:hypothetical protein
MPDAVAEMSLQYEGPAVDAGAMDVRSLAPALIGAADALRDAHTLLALPGSPPKVEIRAARPGSFVVDLAIAELVYHDAVTLLDSPEGSAAGVLSGLVGLVIASVPVIRKIRNRKIATETPAPDKSGDIVIALEDGDILTITSSSLTLASNPAYRSAVHRMVQPLAADDGITRLTLAGASERESITTADLGAFEVPPTRVEDRIESSSEAVLRLERVEFAEDKPWRFSDGSTSFFASVEAPDFLLAVGQGLVRFGNNDLLRVTLRITQTRDAAGKLRTERVITKVHQHISVPAPAGVQLDLFGQPEEPSPDSE